MVEAPKINWSRDETLIALDFYLRHKGKIQKEGPDERRLSHQMRSLAIINGVKLTPKHRNPAGVYMKLMNLRAADPTLNVKGLPHGAAIEEQAWSEFGGRPKQLSRHVDAILKKLSSRPQLSAIEGKIALRQARKDWERAFSEGAIHIGQANGNVFWSEDQHYWANFKNEQPNASRFVTFLGVVQSSFHENTLVEINLPYQGNEQNIQGAVAIDDDGKRWILHQGRLHPGGRRISSEEFARVAGDDAQVLVQFKNGDQRLYFQVANIDAAPAVMRAQLGDFLRLCERVRVHYTRGSALAEAIADVERKERGLFPETSGTYERAGQEAGTGVRSHGAVFAALVASLRSLGMGVANERIGRYGPDLYTDCDIPKLFEIKTSPVPAAVQQGVGQLYLYEQVLGRCHLKILVLPERPSQTLEKCLADLGIGLLEYKRRAKTIFFDDDDLRSAIAAASAE